jgi:hypothetical protein
VLQQSSTCNSGHIMRQPGFTASQATYCDEQFTRALFCTSEMPHSSTAHKLLLFHLR